MKNWWNSLSLAARKTLVTGAGLITLLLAMSTWWALRGDPAVLFSELRPQDAAALTGELDKLKIPYTLADNGSTVLVERAQVPAVRMKLMGRDIPLHGAVGFELFNTTDFGMTEFAQRINYQRALQGELTRTILSFPEIRDARVHLVLPEQGLFKQNTAKAKAAITLALRRGQALRPEQVAGIQRLVAAAVPGLASQEVTVVDQEGVALTRSSDPGSDTVGGGAQLDLKRDTENYLSRKAGAVLEQAFGPGQALASVDVVLNMDQVKVTTEDVLAASDPRSGNPTGVLVRERESARDTASPDPRGTDGRSARGSSLQRDAEYQAGRRIEQVVSQPGAIRRIQVVALVRQQLAAEQRGEIQAVVAAAVGASVDRGDVVVVRSLLASPPEPAVTATAAPVGAEPATSAAPLWTLGVLMAASALAIAGVALRRRAVRRAPIRALSTEERRAALQRVQTWMLQAAPAAGAPVREQRGDGE